MMMLKIFTFYFSLSMSQPVWIAVDACITVLLTWAVSQSKANPRLEAQRPTARILGPQILVSTVGLVIINWLFLIGAFVMLFQQPWFVCNMFDSSAVDVSKWWLLADNFEAEVLAMVCLFQFINNAAVQNFGYKFRRSWWRNYILVFLWAAYLAIVSYWLLADPNNFGCMMRFNCGSPTVLHEMGYYGVTSHVELFNTPLGHNVLPVDFRWRLWGLCIGNVVTGLFFERIIILGPVHEWLARRFPVERLQVKF
jgi:cation-transporting ATPase 13A3/4/5